MSQGPDHIRVLIADYDARFRGALVELLTCIALAKVIGTAGNGREAVDRYFALGPDLVFMDAVMLAPLVLALSGGLRAARRVT